MPVNREGWCRESVTRHTGEQETPTRSLRGFPTPCHNSEWNLSFQLHFRGISANNGERALIYSQMLKLSYARLFITVIYSPRLKWPFTGMEWFPLPLVPYVIIFFKEPLYRLSTYHSLGITALMSAYKRKRAWRQNRNFHFKSSQDACYNTMWDYFFFPG